MSSPTVAIIGGSGLTKLPGFEITGREIVRTPFGEPSSPIITGVLEGEEVAFLARHGHGHTIPPHKVNYRANIWALKQKNIEHIIAFGAVGGIKPEYENGALVVPDQLIDYTYSRAHTYSDGQSGQVLHVDFTYPYTPELRTVLIETAIAHSIDVFEQATYAVTQGPRLETAREIDRIEKDGGDIVGMTSMPEAGLARELAIDYALIAMVVNPAPGRAQTLIGIDQIMQILDDNMPRVLKLIAKSLPSLNR